MSAILKNLYCISPKQLSNAIFFGIFLSLTGYILVSNVIDSPELVRTDFVQFYTGAAIANTDITKLYDHETQVAVQSLHFEIFDRSFRSLPFVARMLQPLALTTPFRANIIMMGVMLTLLFVVIRFYSHSTKDFIVKAIVVGSYLPLAIAIYNTQITILLASIIGIGLLIIRKYSLTSGLVLAMVLVKPQFMLLPFLLVVTAKNKPRYLVGLAAGCIGLMSVGIIELGVRYPFEYLAYLAETEGGHFGTNYFELTSLQTLFAHINYTMADKLTVATVLIVLPIATYLFARFSANLNFAEQVLVAMLITLALNLHSFIFDSLMLIFPLIMLYEEKKLGVTRFLYGIPYITLIAIQYITAPSYLAVAGYMLLVKARTRI